MAQDDNAIGAFLILFRQEWPPEQWCGAAERKKIGGRSDSKQPSGLACPGEVKIREIVSRDLLEAVVLIYPVAQVGEGHRHLIQVALRAFPDSHKAGWIAVR